MNTSVNVVNYFTHIIHNVITTLSQPIKWYCLVHACHFAQ